jgi:hypothetical protein
MRKSWSSRKWACSVQLARRGEVAAERLFQHQPAEAAAGVVGQPRLGQPLGDARHQFGGHRQVVEPADRRRSFVLAQPVAQAVEAAGGGGVGGDVEQVAGEVAPLRLVPRLADGGLRPGDEVLAELLVGELRARHADDAERAGQPPLGERLEQRRHQLAGGQVAGGAEDDDAQRGHERGPGSGLRAGD